MFNQFINERNTLNAHRKRIMSMTVKNNEYRSYKSSLVSFSHDDADSDRSMECDLNLLMSTFTMGGR
jgi:regulatory protein YycI of two-component signal transduction system YycFG